jgi:hypothetical protein
VPLLLRSGERGFEKVLIAKSGQTAVLAKLVVVDGVYHHTAEPPGLGAPPDHRLLG